MDFELTEKEKKAIEALERVAKIWPASLWLFSASGTLCVMRKGENGKRAVDMAGGCESVDRDYIVTDISIDNDGGDW